MTDSPRGSSPSAPRRAAPAGPDTSQSTAGQAKDAAADVADSGRQAAGDVAQTGQQAARDVAGEAKAQADDLLGKTRGQIDEQVEVQRRSTVETLRSVAEQLTALTEHTDAEGSVVDLAGSARDRAHGAAEWLDQRDGQQVLDEVRRMGRERPGAFLLSALAAGVVAGRLTRGAVAAHTDDTDASDRRDTSTRSEDERRTQA